MATEKDKCALCGTEDQGKKTDHLRELFKMSYFKLDRGCFCPRLFEGEVRRLQHGFSSVCSNRNLCRNRQTKKNKIV